MLITIGFTESQRDIDYVSFSDGYKIGAKQESVTIALEGETTGTPTIDVLDGVFAAVGNHPTPETLTGFAGAVHVALTEQVWRPIIRSLSVGDTVTVNGQMWACDRDGWHRVDDIRAHIDPGRV